MSVKDDVLFLLRSKEWVYAGDCERLFPPGTEGHLSWPQRMRQLRAEGHRIIKRKKAGTKHTFEYKLLSGEPPLPEHESAIARDNLLRETEVNMVELAKSVCGIDRKAFEKRGQMAWIP